MVNELLVEVTRNGTVESRHFGVAVVCDFKGQVVKSWGDIDQLVFPRSALKPMLAIHLVESGASEHFSLSDAELSLACSSHQGEPMHQELVESWLERLGLTEDDLACGAVLPEHTESAHKLLASGQHGCRVHHNCSGKHTGFLTTALHLGMSLHQYHHVEHPLQQLSLDILSDLAAVDLKQYPMGIDGCGLPAPTMPLRQLGHAMARFAKPVDLSDSRAQAIYRLHKAITNEPLFIAGHGSVVSELNEITKGFVLAKTGAEGVITAALPKRGLGIAVKIADGGERARAVALLAILNHLGVLTDQEKRQLHNHSAPTLINSRGINVGEICPARSWLQENE
ncbi:MAG: asparaginase [Gammaproteobacteria bacterium]|nr:asparaginase [Gammaproteobacteria bacterium]MCW8986589.1 asparaginase [Gammaproteobacteria bacterium]MCW9032497.1 asparaginase [Gammaproteobacteria bacterium]